MTDILDLTRVPPPLMSGHLRLGGTNPHDEPIDFNSYYMRVVHVPCIPVMGEFHFSRYAAAFWEEELLKIKAGGVDILATYVFWNHIEEDEGVFDWSGNNNLRQFISLCNQHRLQSIVRIGPFAHGECRNGGIPDWLYGRPFALRSNDARYLAYVKRLYGEIAVQLEGLLYKDGGLVIGIQLENEYMHAGAPWEVTFRPGTEYVPRGEDGADHILRLKRLALDAGLDVPIYSCTGWLGSPVPEGEILPMQGGYAFTPWSPDPAYRQPPTREFLFRNRHLAPVLNGDPTYDAAKYPYACCEIGGGIQDTYYHRNIVPPESVEALAVMNLAGGANLIGYYMYHGGTHPIGKHSYMNEFTVPRRSYDFQAPLREFGQIAKSFRHLRLLHRFLHDFGDDLAPMYPVLPENAAAITPDDTTSLRYMVRAKDGAGFIFLNNYQDHVEMQDIPGIQFTLQLPDETLTIPQNSTLTLRKNVSAILPFGLNLDGIRLKYASTQLLTKLVEDDATTYVFFAPHGMVSEYAFDAASYQSLDVTGVTVNDGIVTMSPGEDSLISITANNGKVVRILTLSRAQAENAAKVSIHGRERLVISDSVLVTDWERIFCHIQEQDALNLSVYPPLENPLNTAAGAMMVSQEGIFARYTAPLPAKEIRLDIEHISPDKAIIRIPADMLDDVNNVLLRVDYIGDIGNCYINGILVSDHFYNGTPWEIGLKQIIEPGSVAELFIMITPIRGQSAAGYVPTGMAFNLTDGATTAEIRSIIAVPQYRIEIM